MMLRRYKEMKSLNYHGEQLKDSSTETTKPKKLSIATKQEAIEAIYLGENFKQKAFDKFRDDLEVAIAYVHEAFIQSRPKFRLVEPTFIDNISGNLQGQPRALANEYSDLDDLIFALKDAIKIRNLEAAFQKNLANKPAPKRTIKI